MVKLSLFLFLGLATTCYATDFPVPSSLNASGFSGVYAGINGGYGFGKESPYAPKGAFGGVFVGSGFTLFPKFYLGAEMGYARCAITRYRRATPLADLIKFKVKDHLEVATRIGYEGENKLPYVKLGYAWSASAITNQTNGRKFFDGTLSGFAWGLGLDVKISQAFSAGVAYTSAELKNKKKGRFSKLKTQNVSIRLVYHF